MLSVSNGMFYDCLTDNTYYIIYWLVFFDCSAALYTLTLLIAHFKTPDNIL